MPLFFKWWQFRAASAPLRDDCESKLRVPITRTGEGRVPDTPTHEAGGKSGSAFGLFGIEPQMVNQASQFARCGRQQQFAVLDHIGKRAEQFITLL